MSEALLRLEGLQKSFGGLRATDDVSLDVLPGDLHAIIGPNGAGKTTLLNQVSGLLTVDSGRIIFAKEDITAFPVHSRARIGIARTFQITSIIPGFTAMENVMLAMQGQARSTFSFIWPAARDAAAATAAHEALAEVGLSSRAAILAGQLSHGEKRALELAMALALKPRLLLLDEPAAGAGPSETQELVEMLARLKRRYAMLLIEHDMQAVFALADRISVLVYGRIIASGTPDDIRADPAVKQAYLGEEAA